MQVKGVCIDGPFIQVKGRVGYAFVNTTVNRESYIVYNHHFIV